MPVDADTKKYLDEVKKGKARRFVMISKGAKILSMIVYKKGALEKFKKQAKEDGKGQFYHGVVDGKGMNITFKLQRSDGYEQPPGKELILKDFLKTEADMQFKPSYEIVETLPAVDESDEGAAAAATAPTTVPTDEPPSAPPPPPSPPPSAEFMTRLKRLVPDLKKAQATGTPLADQLTKLTAQAQALGKNKEFEEGLQTLDELAGLIQQVLSAAATPPPAPPPPSAGPTEFMNRLKGLMPDLKKAQAADTPFSEQLTRLTAQAQALGKEKKFTEGLQLLDELAGVIQQAHSASASPVDAATFMNRLKALLPDLKRAQEADTPLQADLQTLTAQAQALGKQKKFTEGMEVLAELAAAIQQALAPTVAETTAGDPMANWRKAKDQFDDALAEVGKQLEQLGSLFLGLSESEFDTEPERAMVRDLHRIAQEGLPSLTNVKLTASILAVQQAAQSDRQAEAKKGIEAVDRFLARLDDAAVTAVDENQFGVKVTMRATLGPALKNLRDAFEGLKTSV